MGRRLIIEADGAARGNPGPASYGALVRDADTGEVVAESARTLGVATNNVAEYSGLIAGLEAAFGLDPAAEVEVRMDSKLVVEQMSGAWKIKNAGLRPLALRARALIPAPGQVRWTWVPRAENAAADRLANEALDAPQPARPDGGSTPGHDDGSTPEDTGAGRHGGTGSAQPAGAPGAASEPAQPRVIGWTEQMGTPTTLLMLRHGETEHTAQRRFSGHRYDPELSERGVAQARATACHLAARGGVDVVVSSPLRRAHQTAQLVAGQLGVPVAVEHGLAECDFGDWDGLTFDEVAQRWPDELAGWLSGLRVAAPGGESLSDVAERVATAERVVLAEHPGSSVVLVAHVTPIKLLVRFALDAPPEAIHRLQMAPASLSLVRHYADGNRVLEGFNDTGHLGELARTDWV